VDSFARACVKTKVRIRSKNTNESLKDVETKNNRTIMSTNSIRSSIIGKIPNLNATKKEQPAIKEDPVLKVVEPHREVYQDSVIDSLRKQKDMEKKIHIIQLQKLKEIQEEEEIQHKQVQKLQQEMKSKSFV